MHTVYDSNEVADRATTLKVVYRRGTGALIYARSLVPAGFGTRLRLTWRVKLSTKAPPIICVTRIYVILRAHGNSPKHAGTMHRSYAHVCLIRMLYDRSKSSHGESSLNRSRDLKRATLSYGRRTHGLLGLSDAEVLYWDRRRERQSCPCRQARLLGRPFGAVVGVRERDPVTWLYSTYI